jgi:hypothetical protein
VAAEATTVHKKESGSVKKIIYTMDGRRTSMLEETIRRRGTAGRVRRIATRSGRSSEQVKRNSPVPATLRYT